MCQTHQSSKKPEHKPGGHGQFNPSVHSTASGPRTEGLRSLCLVLFHIPLAALDAGALLRIHPDALMNPKMNQHTLGR